MLTKKRSARKQLGDYVKSIDIYGERFNFQVDGQEHHRTYFGTLLSLLVFITLGIYATKRFNILMDRGDTKYQTTYDDNSLDVDRVFTGEEVSL